MDNSVPLYRKARLYWKSGDHRDLMLTQAEILSFSTAISQKNELKTKGMDSFTLWYDSDLSEEHRKLSFLIALDSVAGLEIDDVEYTLEDLQKVDMSAFSLWKNDLAFKKTRVKKKSKQKRKKTVSKKPKKIKRNKISGILNKFRKSF